MHKFKKNKAIRNLIIIFTVILLFFYPVLFSKVMFPKYAYKIMPLYHNVTSSVNIKTINYEDVLFNTFPWASVVSKDFKNFTLPLWQFNNLAGLPLLGNDQSQAFYPLIFPFFFFVSTAVALQIEVFLKILVVAFGGYLLSSLYTKRSSVRIIGSLILAFNGFISLWLYWPLSSAIVMLPYIFWLIEKSYSKKDKLSPSKIIIFGSLICAMELLAGTIEMSLILLVPVILYLIFIQIRDQQRIQSKVLLYLSFAALLGFLISAIQTYPAIVDLLRSYYYVARSGAASKIYDAINPVYLLKFIYPGIFGPPQSVNIPGALGLIASNFNETSFFIGLPAFFIGIFAFIRKETRKKAFFILGLIFIIVGILINTPIFNLIFKLPYLNDTLHHRIDGVIPILYVILIFIGLDSIYHLIKNKEYTRLFKYTFVFSVIIVFLDLLILYSFSKIRLLYIGQSATTSVLHEGLLFILMIVLSTFVIYILKVIKRESNTALFVIILIGLFSIFPLFTYFQTYWTYININNQKYLSPKNSYIQLFKNNPEYRVLPTKMYAVPQTNDLSGFNEYASYDPVTPNSYFNYNKNIGKNELIIFFFPNNITNSSIKWLETASVKYVIVKNKTYIKGTKILNPQEIKFDRLATSYLKSINMLSKTNLAILYNLGINFSSFIQDNHINIENKENLEKFVSKYIKGEEEYKKFKNLDLQKNLFSIYLPPFSVYKLQNTVPIVYAPENIIFKKGTSENTQLKDMQTLNIPKVAITNAPFKNTTNNSSVKITNYKIKGNSISFTANTKNKNAFLLVNELFYPGFKAYDNSKNIPLYRSNGIFDGMYIKKGVNKIVIMYKPQSVNIAIVLSLLGILFLLLVIGFRKKIDKVLS